MTVDGSQERSIYRQHDCQIRASLSDCQWSQQNFKLRSNCTVAFEGMHDEMQGLVVFLQQFSSSA